VQRQLLSQVAGSVGLALYNWWVVASFDRRMVPGPDELFSDLEATGQPYSRVLSRVDVAAGALILIALLLHGTGRTGRWARQLLMLFAACAVVGGLFPYTCAEGINPACRSAEWTMALPWQHYVHVVAGVVEFAAATAAILVLRGQETVGNRARHIAGRLVQILVVAYPLLAVAYLSGKLGVLIEPVFFVSFSAAVALVLFERADEPVVSGSRTAVHPPRYSAVREIAHVRQRSRRSGSECP
jgi:hypothetical protein